MSGVSRVAFFLAGCLLAGCSALRTDVRSEAPPGYQADAASKAASVDWSKIQTVSVGMDEYDYLPSSLNFEVGKPYRLHLGNSGSKSHTFSSEPFFKSIAGRRLTTKEGVVRSSFHTGTRRGGRGRLPTWSSWRWLQEITRWCAMNRCMKCSA